MSGLRSLLIANRGEIAVRIIRTAHKHGITCAVIYSSGEEKSLFVREADSAFCLGKGPFSETYLNISKIVDIAVSNNFDAIHPGYGFLSENAEFAKACEDAGIIFVGPDSNQIRLMSNKVEARKYVASLGIPLLHSIHFNPLDYSQTEAEVLPYPLIIKAAAGGGGKGMHIVHNPDELIEGIKIAQRESKAYFGDDHIYIEKYLELPRHIEVQLLGDKHGNIIHLYDRECTIQRRHQKIIEEAPSSFLSIDTRNKILEAAITIGKSMNYTSAGTIEFLLDGNSQFYFLEMNTRIQVEHPVTEIVTGIDIVDEQLKIARGEILNLKQDDIVIHGHGLECRIYAEDAFNHFQPSSGMITHYQQPSELLARVDTCMDVPTEVSSDFDPMIAKVIVQGKNRIEAREKMKIALKNYVIHGINSNINYLNEVLDHPGYIKNILSTMFCKIAAPKLVDTFENKLRSISIEVIVAVFLIATFSAPGFASSNISISAWQNIGYWRNFMDTELEIFGQKHYVRFTKPSENIFKIWLDNNNCFLVNGHRDGQSVKLNYNNNNILTIVTPGEHYCYITSNDVTFQVRRTDIIHLKKNKINGQGKLSEVIAPLNGKILKVNIKIAEMVKKGDTLMIVESMKMENHILATHTGTVEEIFVSTGDKVVGRDILALVKSS